MRKHKRTAYQKDSIQGKCGNKPNQPNRLFLYFNQVWYCTINRRFTVPFVNELLIQNFFRQSLRRNQCLFGFQPLQFILLLLLLNLLIQYTDIRIHFITAVNLFTHFVRKLKLCRKSQQLQSSFLKFFLNNRL